MVVQARLELERERLSMVVQARLELERERLLTVKQARLELEREAFLDRAGWARIGARGLFWIGLAWPVMERERLP